MSSFTESILEQATLDILSELGYTTLNANEIAPDSPNEERTTYSDIILTDRLQSALISINPNIPFNAIEEAIRKVSRTHSPSLIENNKQFHKYLTEGIDVEYSRENRIKYDKVWLIDFNNPENNNFLALNQFTVIENKHNRRPDVVIFINGIPIAVIELKNPSNENATIRGAFNQLQTYKKEIPSLFHYNQILIASDGIEARFGTITADWERFMPWRTIDGETIAPKGSAELEIMIRGMFQEEILIDILRYFIVFETDGESIIKKMAGYHQYHAVNKAIKCSIKATSDQGDKKVGVVWHTQGSGKSLTMAFYAAKITQQPELNNPTLIVLTDRNDLDDQLFTTFSNCIDLLRQTPQQAESRQHLQEYLKDKPAGGIIFTTIHKFAPPTGEEEYPVLSERRNIIFITDEAHRSQYGLKAKMTKKDDEAYLSYGYAKYVRDGLPNASFLGFTGTPIEQEDKSTPALFGDYIDIYDIQRAVEDDATKKIYYESRLAKINLNESQRPIIDAEFEEITESEEATTKEKLKSKWARLEALVGAEKRIEQIASDIVNHFENRLASIDGKGMIVCMSRRICVDLYNQIIKLRPEWHHEDDNHGFIKVVMSGSASDDPNLQIHTRNKKRRKNLATGFKKPEDELKLVIVRDMWLTGFDAPCLHTMYADKPMKGHNLMQAIARVNRVFRDKPGGLIVDYIGIVDQLKSALQHYTDGDQENTGIPTAEALAVLQEKYEIVKSMYHRLDYSIFFTGSPRERLAIIPASMDYILELEDGKKRYLKAVTELSKAFAICSSLDEASAIRDEVGFFQAIKVAIVKHTITDRKDAVDLDFAIKQIVSKAVISDKVIDIFEAAGIDKPDISILSDKFLEEVRGLPYKNLALETLRKLLNDEIKIKSRKNITQSRSFLDLLDATVKKYQNRAIETAQIIDESINLAKEFREAMKRGENLGLSEDEIAFYDALDTNDSAVQILGDETLKMIARDLVEAVKRNISIDWNIKESAKAKIKVVVKRLLRKYGYPPDKQEKATETVLKQAEHLCVDWAI
ncbi:MAG: type I restriction endonuclease subunit R [Gomphosphaeria aponina SAG 52.96 = DSM 107014]|uniref:Type I restriction enzyme endonuclease subunit n=1 Tax=Gomphosphaeria aponina SAG 52.96 = DSM 107014 TaxID=1521640 RepID=A0A941GSZ7_9CHRO|nr:type I restriction endonuclease subunit R [Gomphosphaeria aponina SAG 52.96 = DSM 107014]